ncbi:MAG: YlxR family protein [Actinomycetota bacterium]
MRIVRTPDGEVRLDTGDKLPGRGAYLCQKKECFQEAMKKRAIQRALKVDLQNKGLEIEKDFYLIVDSLRKGEDLENSRTG